MDGVQDPLDGILLSAPGAPSFLDEKQIKQILITKTL